VVILIEKKNETKKKKKNTEDSKMCELRGRIAAPGVAQSKKRKKEYRDHLLFFSTYVLNAQ
jgi:hypothetical protein